jgi:putative acyl-CoA dehydrogenase
MIPEKPLADLPTHQVENMPPHMGDQDLWQSDQVLRKAVVREGARSSVPLLSAFGKTVGAENVFELADQANRFPPQLKAFDRYGMRLNQVTFHPAYHDLMELAVQNELASFAWNHEGPGAHVTNMALVYMMCQTEGGVLCPMAMTYSSIPPLRSTPAISDEWIPRLLSKQYDPRDIPVTKKAGATMGMFMTEKQGGSDVRSNSTHAVAEGSGRGIGTDYLLTGHKYFCSAPMCDAFLTLAYTEEGLSCFMVPRWNPQGERNSLYIQQLKDKLGNRSNASAEIELQDTWGVMVGDEGHGIRTIIEMVQGTRIYCCTSSAAMMRQAFVQALHYAAHRKAFGKYLIDQPLMRNVLADLALEAESAMVLSMRVARALDHSSQDESEASLARIGTAIAKYWNCKRAPAHIFEAMECHGGSGYIEESILPRLYREAPVNSIWEGSGNVVCLDVLRAMQREEGAVPAILAEMEQAIGAHPLLDSSIDALKELVILTEDSEFHARNITEKLALTLQGSLLARHAPSFITDAFCTSRLAPEYRGAFGTLPSSADIGSILKRTSPM